MNLTSTLDLILDVARARGTQPATKLVLHPATHRSIEREGHLPRLDRCGIPVELDPGIPVFPGFAVHRTPRG